MAKKTELEKAIKELKIPFDLYAGFSLVIDELNKKSFIFSDLTTEGAPIITFISTAVKEKILINIDKENLLIRQFSILEDDKRKLKVLYVLKPSERDFKLV